MKGYEHVNAIPSGFSYQTIVLPDVIVNNLPSTVKHISAYNYKIQNWEQTYEIADNFIEKVQKIEINPSMKDLLFVPLNQQDRYTK